MLSNFHKDNISNNSHQKLMTVTNAMEYLFEKKQLAENLNNPNSVKEFVRKVKLLPYDIDSFPPKNKNYQDYPNTSYLMEIPCLEVAEIIHKFFPSYNGESLTEEDKNTVIALEDEMNLEHQQRKFKVIKNIQNTSNGQTLRHIPGIFKNDKDVVLAVVTKDGMALQYAPLHLRNDKDVVFEAVMQNPWSLKYASKSLQDDLHIAFAAITNGWGVPYLSCRLKEELKHNPDVVLAAVKENGLALQYADPILKIDQELVIAAVRENTEALEYADPYWITNQKKIYDAIKNNKDTIDFADSTTFDENSIELSGEELAHNIGKIEEEVY